MIFREVPDYKLDPPEGHICHDETDCEYCHDFHMDGEFSETYGRCLLCRDYLDWQISIGRMCQHFEKLPVRGGCWCGQCEDFYLKLNLTGETDEQ